MGVPPPALIDATRGQETVEAVRFGLSRGSGWCRAERGGIGLRNETLGGPR